MLWDGGYTPSQAREGGDAPSCQVPRGQGSRTGSLQSLQRYRMQRSRLQTHFPIMDDVWHTNFDEAMTAELEGAATKGGKEHRCRLAGVLHLTPKNRLEGSDSSLTVRY